MRTGLPLRIKETCRVGFRAFPMNGSTLLVCLGILAAVLFIACVLFALLFFRLYATEAKILKLVYRQIYPEQDPHIKQADADALQRILRPVHSADEIIRLVQQQLEVRDTLLGFLSEYTALREVIAYLSKNSPSVENVSALLEKTKTILGADSVFIGQYSDATASEFVRYIRSYGLYTANEEIEKQALILTKLIEGREFYFYPESEGALKDQRAESILRAAGCEMFLATDIVFNRTRWGQLTFFYKKRRAFNQPEIPFITSLLLLIRFAIRRMTAREELARSNQALREAVKQAEVEARLKTSFVETLSHDLRTPLSAIIGYLDLLKTPGITDEQQHEFYRGIDVAANAMHDIANNVLDYASSQAYTVKTTHGCCDVPELFREMKTLFGFRAARNRTTLRITPPTFDYCLNIHSIHLRRILINLIGNAVKFTENGFVEVKCEIQPIEHLEHRVSVDFQVLDSGIGMRPEHIPLLFKPFVRFLNSSEMARYPGSGLGLSIVKNLVETYNGTITVESVYGRGSSFHVRFPEIEVLDVKTTPAAEAAQTALAPAEEQGTPPADRPPAEQTPAADRVPATGPETPSAEPAPPATGADAAASDEDAVFRDCSILLIDDIGLNNRILALLLGKLGFRKIYSCLSGEEAIELLNKQPIDLVLTDVWIPQMSGYDLSHRIHETARFKNLPIIAITADLFLASKKPDMVAAFDAIIIKPVSIDELRRTIRKVLSHKRKAKAVKGEVPEAPDHAP